MKKIFNVVLACAVFFMIGCGADKPPKSKHRSEKKIEKTKKQTEAQLETDEGKIEAVKAPVSLVPPEQLEKAKEMIANVSEKDLEGVDTEGRFKIFCSICHGRKGDMSMNGSKKLSKSKITLEESVAQIYFGKGTMTPHKGLLKDVEIVAIAKYIEGFRQ